VRKPGFVMAAFVLAVVFPVRGQILDSLSLRLSPEVLIPVAGSAGVYDVGGGAAFEARLPLPVSAPLFGLAEIRYSLAPTPADKSLSLLSGGLGIGAQHPLSPRIGVGVSASGGYYAATWGEESAARFYAKTRAEATYRITPTFSVALGGSYGHYFGPNEPLYQAAAISLAGGINVGGLRGGTSVEAPSVKLDPVFPIFHAYYDKKPFGSVTILNREDGDIYNVRVSFYVKQYMDQPKLSATYPSIPQGRSVEAPLLALFNEQVLRLTESTRVSAEIVVDYSFLGSPRQARFTDTLRLYHRNAMTWDDDRKAAAFVSAKDPAVLRYSKFAAGLIRETGGNEVDQNLRFAMGLFEGLRLYGLNYVVDPTTPYKEISSSKGALDYLQLPYQTLVYRGGDCDDLSIMFAAVLESVGIKTAFITIPGHIYMAFALAMDEAAARATFLNPDELIFAEGAVWVPVEITLVNEGFNKAWSVGAREWQDNVKAAGRLFAIESAWDAYEPVGIPGEDTRIVLPEAKDIVAAYGTSLARFVEREVAPRAEKLRSDIRLGGNNPALVNKLGVLYARYGMLSEARTEFERAARGGYSPAVTNLGNVAYLQKDYQAALANYQQALRAAPGSKAALLGLARTQYELENYPDAGRAFAQVKDLDPKLAAGYPYLASRTEDAARASAGAAQRTTGAAWSEE
jgi:tetratricopeptide (TPR) repeat protein